MKRCRLAAIVFFVSFFTAACAGSQDITTEKMTQQPEEPVIVLGDENLPKGTEENDGIPSEEQPQTEKSEPEDSVSGACVSENTADRAAVEGPVLVIGAAPQNAVLEHSETDSDGGYTEILLCEDEKVSLSIERIRDSFPGDTIQDIQDFYAEKGNWQQVISAGQDAALSESLGYPVYRFRYVTGEGEESVMHNSMYTVYKEYGFFLDASAEASDYPDMEELMDAWIETVWIFDE